MSLLQRLKLWSREQAGLAPLAQEQCGVIADRPDPRDRVRDKVAAAPLSFSLGAYGIQRPLDQGRTSSCTGHAGAAFVSNLYGRVKPQRAAWSPSPYWLYYRARERGGLLGADGGAMMRDLMKTLAEDGSAPTYMHAPSVKAVPDDASLRMAKFTRIREYQRILPGPDAPNQMMTALAVEKLPILTGVRLYPSVNSADTRWSGVLKTPETTEITIGGHALMIDGYDTKNELFSGWNSWGASWGDGGRFYLPFAYVSQPELMLDIWTGDFKLW